MALTDESLAVAIRGDLSDASRLRPVAVRLCADYAPGAPPELLEEAAIRVSGYLLDAPPSPAGSGHADAMTNSGAAALLTAYRVRLGAVIGGDDAP